MPSQTIKFSILETALMNGCSNMSPQWYITGEQEQPHVVYASGSRLLLCRSLESESPKATD